MLLIEYPGITLVYHDPQPWINFNSYIHVSYYSVLEVHTYDYVADSIPDLLAKIKYFLSSYIPVRCLK